MTVPRWLADRPVELIRPMYPEQVLVRWLLSLKVERWVHVDDAHVGVTLALDGQYHERMRLVVSTVPSCVVSRNW